MVSLFAVKFMDFCSMNFINFDTIKGSQLKIIGEGTLTLESDKGEVNELPSQMIRDIHELKSLVNKDYQR